MDGNPTDCCLLCGEQLDGNGDVASPNSCTHVFHLICIKNWADIEINANHPVTCPLQSCLKPFQSIGVKKNSKTMKVVNVVPVDQDWSCPICLNSMNQVNEIGNPEVCNHHFCLKCLLEWSQTNTSCPLDRMEFRIIFVKNAVGGAIQRRVRTPQRDLRADLTDGESENTEDDVEVTVANAVSNSLVVAATELMRNRMRNATCPQCNMTVGAEAVVCSSCNNTYHRQCARVRDARGDQWRCLECRNTPAVQRGDTRGGISLTRARRNGIVFNEWHNDLLQQLGNRNYHSSDDDTYSFNTEHAVTDVASNDSINSLTSESELSLSCPPRTTEVLLRSPNRVSSSDSDDVCSGGSDSDDADSVDDDSADSENVNSSRQTRQNSRRRLRASRRPVVEPVHTDPFEHDLSSRFSDESDDSFHPRMVPPRERVNNNSSSSSRSSSSVDTNSDIDERDGRYSRVSNRRYRRPPSSGSSSSEASKTTPSRVSDYSDSDFVETRLTRRRRVRCDSDDSEMEGSVPKRPRLGSQRASTAMARVSRPRRQAAPVNLAESSFNDSIQEPRASSSRHRSSRNQDRQPSSSSGGDANRNRGAATAVPRRPPTSSASMAATRRQATGASSRRPTAGPSRRRNAGSARTSGKRKKSSTKKRKASNATKRKSSAKVSHAIKSERETFSLPRVLRVRSRFEG